ncbi:DNA primase [Candidatus Nomurabacteria bacterium]|nr:DNA primase [Candidatus Nomurabacteria bacterium]
MNSPAQKIKERLTIEEVVSSYIKLDRVGDNLKAKCPFHNEKTPSFFVSPARASYYCFGCGAKGDIFTFVQEFEGLDFKGALKLLAERAGVELAGFNKEDQKNQSEKEKLFEVMEEATLFFINNLSKNKEVLDYLTSRGLTEESIKNFRIGYVSLDWRTLYDHLKRKGFSDGEMEKAGLIKKSEKGFYDRFRGRVMFPIGDSSGRIIAFSGRIFIDDEKSAKYLNSPDTVLFNKSAVLYGLDRAKDSIRKNNFSILVEGQMDLILSHQAGYKNTIATSGTALSDSTVAKENAISNLGLVRRLTDNIVLAFDADRAGFVASNRAGKIALSLGMDVKVAQLPEGVDPADLISKSGPQAWKEAIRNSTHIILFLLNRILKDGAGDMRKSGREIKEKILPYVNSLGSSIEKAHFIKKISDVSSIPISALEADLKKIEQESRLEKKEIEEVLEVEKKLYRKDHILKRLLGIIFWQKTLKDRILDIEKVLSEIKSILEDDFDKLIKDMEESKEDLIFEAEVFYGGGLDFKKDIEELISNLEEEYLKEKLGYKMRELHTAEEHKEQNKAPEILKEINDINNKIQDIKNKRLTKI